MKDRLLPINPLETVSLERARAEMAHFFYSRPQYGVVTVWNPDTDTECRCSREGGSCASARFFSPHCKHWYAIKLRHQARKAAATH